MRPASSFLVVAPPPFPRRLRNPSSARAVVVTGLRVAPDEAHELAREDLQREPGLGPSEGRLASSCTAVPLSPCCELPLLACCRSSCSQTRAKGETKARAAAEPRTSVSEVTLESSLSSRPRAPPSFYLSRSPALPGEPSRPPPAPARRAQASGGAAPSFNEGHGRSPRSTSFSHLVTRLRPVPERRADPRSFRPCPPARSPIHRTRCRLNRSIAREACPVQHRPRAS